MNRDDIQKLLGGYATGTLTPEEQRALFDTALTDQELFDALMREEPLRDVLGDPSARAQLLAALDDAPAPWHRAWWRPMLVMGAVLLAVAGVAVWDRSQQRERAPEVAQVERPRFQSPVASQTAPPVLPAPPEMKLAPPAMKAIPLPPAATPLAPPPPPRATPTILAAPRAGRPTMLPQPQGLPQQFRQAQPQPAPSQAIIVDGAPRQDAVPVQGTVTDTSGAAIAGANVAVKSLDTGVTVNASTDARGAFSASATPGANYQITASKEGFQSASAKDVAPVTGTAAPVNLQLPVAAAATTVEVQASTGALEGRMAAPMANAQGEVVPVLSYRLLRAVRGASPVEVPADGTVPTRSELTLRVTPAADGELRIEEGTRTIATRKVHRGIVTAIKLPRFDQPGRVELQLTLSSTHVIVAFHVE